jgi:hypothetical protein
VHKTSKMNLTRKQNLRLSLTLQRTVTSVHTLTYNKAAHDFFRTEEVVIGAEQDTGVGNRTTEERIGKY